MQGGLLADGINSMFAALATVPPVVVYAQNNGVIAFTGVASRLAGVACGVWLMLFGIFAKFGAVIAFAPTCVLGPLQLFVWSSVGVTGIRVSPKLPELNLAVLLA